MWTAPPPGKGQETRQAEEVGDYPSYFGVLLVAPSVRPIGRLSENADVRIDEVTDWFVRQLDALSRDNPPEPHFTRAHEGLLALRSLLEEGDTDGASRLWDDLTYEGPTLFEAGGAPGDVVRAQRQAAAASPAVGDRVRVAISAHADIGPRDIHATGTVKEVRPDGRIVVDMGSPGLRDVVRDPKAVQVVEPVRSERGTRKRSKSESSAGRPMDAAAASELKTQAPPDQRSARTRPDSSTTVRTSPPSKYAGPARTTGLGSVDATTDRIVVQIPKGESHEEQLAWGIREAEAKKPVLDALLSSLGVAGAQFSASRTKTLDRVRVKSAGAANPKPPATISDYLAARIILDRPGAADDVKKALEESGRANIVDDDDFLATGKLSKGGHRARNLQVELGDGFSAEVQMVARETYEVRKQTHAQYEIMREPGVTPEAYQRAQDEAVRINDDAWARFLARQEQEAQREQEGEGEEGAGPERVRPPRPRPLGGPHAADAGETGEGGQGLRGPGVDSDAGPRGDAPDVAGEDGPRPDQGDRADGAHLHPTEPRGRDRAGVGSGCRIFAKSSRAGPARADRRRRRAKSPPRDRG